MRYFRICFPRGCRSDMGYSKPILDELYKENEITILPLKLDPGDFESSYIKSSDFLDINNPDLVLIIGDRIEMTALACAAFHKKIPIAHYGSGIRNYPITTFDDINRHCIALWSTIQFCDCEISRSATIRLFNIINKETNYICNVGITHLDNLEIDESLVPKHKYDLILYNPPTLFQERLEDLLQMQTVDHNSVIWIGPNPDFHKPPFYVPNNCVYYPNLPRPQFFGLLKNCSKFYTNSSAGWYEAPHFLSMENIILLGSRNKQRTFTYFREGASKRIVELLKLYWYNINHPGEEKSWEI